MIPFADWFNNCSICF